jgi:serine/threonine protein kinase
MYKNLPIGSKVLDGEYLLGETLGKGVTSLVKKGVRLSDGLEVAVKLHKRPTKEDIAGLAKEVDILNRMPHQNMVNLVETIEKGIVY